MLKVCFTIVLFFGSLSSASAPSAVRSLNQSWKIYKQKFEFQEQLKFKIFQNSKSAFDSRLAYNQIDINQIPEFQKNAEEAQKIFEDIRNIRFLEDPRITSFARRITWLYPMDGCFARAEWVAHLLRKNDPNIQFGRVFIFGDLEVQTKNSMSGYVTWWYHVAVVVRMQGKAFVFDPSLELVRPLELGEWVKLQVPYPSQDVELAFCSEASYSPDSDCHEKQMLSDDEAADEISSFLTAERGNLKKLGRDPDVELGNSPPW